MVYRTLLGAVAGFALISVGCYLLFWIGKGAGSNDEKAAFAMAAGFLLVNGAYFIAQFVNSANR